MFNKVENSLNSVVQTKIKLQFVESPSYSEISLDIEDSPVPLTKQQIKNGIKKEIRIKMRKVAKAKKFIIPIVKNIILILHEIEN